MCGNLKITRRELQDLVGERCECCGIVSRKTLADATHIGINVETENRCMLTNVHVAGIYTQHIWIATDSFMDIDFGKKVIFTAIVMPYSKGFNGRIMSFGLIDVQDVQIEQPRPPKFLSIGISNGWQVRKKV